MSRDALNAKLINLMEQKQYREALILAFKEQASETWITIIASNLSGDSVLEAIRTVCQKHPNFMERYFFSHTVPKWA